MHFIGGCSNVNAFFGARVLRIKMFLIVIFFVLLYVLSPFYIDITRALERKNISLRKSWEPLTTRLLSHLRAIQNATVSREGRWV